MRKRFSGKNLYRAPLLLGATPMLSACGLWQDSSEPPAQPETPPDMQVEVKLRSLHRCSRISPEMVVTNVPRGTDYFDVRLLENEPQERLMGGGSWAQLPAYWVATVLKNFPMALLRNLFAAGPVTRLLFRRIFRRQLAQA